MYREAFFEGHEREDQLVNEAYELGIGIVRATSSRHCDYLISSAELLRPTRGIYWVCEGMASEAHNIQRINQLQVIAAATGTTFSVSTGAGRLPP